METFIITGHEETLTKGDVEKTLGVITNLSKESPNWRDSTIYVYHKEMYIFFESMFDMINYLFYGESKMKRAYMEEDVFDSYFDADYIQGTFSEKLEWVSTKTEDN